MHRKTTGRLAILHCLLLFGCQKQVERHEEQATTVASGSKLDGMQLDSARRVALQSAADAMKARNLPRLKQLSSWVRGRAQVVIFQASELDALDLAIACLEAGTAPADTKARLQSMQPNKLRAPASELCAVN